MTYDEELKSLSAAVGGRNRRLLGLALKGRLAGRDAETMIAEIVAASGDPPLTTGEVRRAVDKAMKVQIVAKRRGNPRLSALLHSTSTPRPQLSTSTSSYSFVREMIEKGGGTATSAELVALSKVPIPKLPWVQAINFLMMLEEPDSGVFFMGTPRTPRTRDNLWTLNEAEVEIIDHANAFSTHILPNDLTGEAVINEKGEYSYAREACVLHARYTIIEFDEMPLKEQAAFWKGVILSDLLPLRALVYSGGKSIHGLLRLDDTKDFKAQWKVLERHLASDADLRYRCDTAFRSPVQMMRLPGAIRPETRRRQSLLYLA